jgi:hypothetical protein
MPPTPWYKRQNAQVGKVGLPGLGNEKKKMEKIYLYGCNSDLCLFGLCGY